MKKIAAFVLALAMLGTLAACGGSGKGGSKAFERGTVSGQTYTSEFLGVTATFDQAWHIASDEEMAQLSGETAEAMDNAKYQEALENGKLVYDLYAMDGNTGSSVNINVEKLGALGGAVVTEEAYVDASLKTLEEDLAGAGIQVSSTEKVTLTFAGAEHLGIRLQGTIQGVDLYETLVVLKCGGYIACVTASTFLDDTTDTILALFQAA